MYSIVFSRKTKQDWYLEFEVFSDTLNRCLFEVKLLLLSSNEIDLNQGRFTNFRREPQENQIVLFIDVSNEVDQWMKNIIEWIAEHSKDAWSLCPLMYDVGKGEVKFSFADPKVAVLFALVWK